MPKEALTREAVRVVPYLNSKDSDNKDSIGTVGFCPWGGTLTDTVRRSTTARCIASRGANPSTI